MHLASYVSFLLLSVTYTFILCTAIRLHKRINIIFIKLKDTIDFRLHFGYPSATRISLLMRLTN